MKDGRRFIKMILLLTLIMGSLTISLMVLSRIRDKNNTYITIDIGTMKLVQLEDPKEGDPIAIIDTSVGEIRIVLYPQYSPNAVKNFTDLAEKGYYDNTYVFDSQDGAYAGCGAKNQNGTVGDDTDERIERELHQDLWPFSRCMYDKYRIQPHTQRKIPGRRYLLLRKPLQYNKLYQVH
jgi:peptidyl-prolyl cis-trans isomerase B (cyclophilin B)